MDYIFRFEYRSESTYVIWTHYYQYFNVRFEHGWVLIRFILIFLVQHGNMFTESVWDLGFQRWPSVLRTTYIFQNSTDLWLTKNERERESYKK